MAEIMLSHCQAEICIYLKICVLNLLSFVVALVAPEQGGVCVGKRGKGRGRENVY